MPSLSITAARITEPAVGACVWASGSHVCNGTSGTLMANAMAKDAKIRRPAFVENPGFAAMSTRLNVSWPPTPRWCSTAVATRPTSISAEPNIV